nr:glutathione S-transferase GSTS8-4 [Brachionus angularis]
MINYRLVYFNARGRAEVIRYILAYADQKYEDFRVNESDWQVYKSKTLFGKLPVLEISDGSATVQLAQSLAIARFLAAQYGLVGTTELEKARADMIGEQLADVLNMYNLVRFETNPELKAKNESLFFRETLPYYASLFEKMFEAQKTTFVAADILTWADFAFAAFWDLIGDKKDPIFETCEICKTMVSKVENLPQIKEWKRTRPETLL